MAALRRVVVIWDWNARAGDVCPSITIRLAGLSVSAPPMYRESLSIRILLISDSSAMHAALAGVLSRACIDVDLSPSVERAITLLNQNSFPVVLISSEMDWIHFLRRASELPEIPSTIVLLNAFDAALWANALQQNAFDAIPMNAGQDRLIDTVRSGFRRWERRRLVRAALSQNPLYRTDLLH